MGSKYLVDTNILIYFTKGQMPPSVLDATLDILRAATPATSVINEMEFLGYPSNTDQDILQFRDFLSSFHLLPLTTELRERTITIRRTYRMKLPDAIIAAMALVHTLTLVSRNDKDFQRIPDLRYRNPFAT